MDLAVLQTPLRRVPLPRLTCTLHSSIAPVAASTTGMLCNPHAKEDSDRHKI
jgi:hypothetical protein